MVASLVKLILCTISAIINLITRALFSTTAYFVVILIQALKVPGKATNGIIEQAGEAIKSVLGYVIGIFIEVTSIIISKIIDVIKDGIIGSITTGSSTMVELVDKTRTSIEGVIVDSVPKIIEGFSEMVTKLVSDLWSNSIEALGYVKENV